MLYYDTSIPRKVENNRSLYNHWPVDLNLSVNMEGSKSRERDTQSLLKMICSAVAVEACIVTKKGQ